MSIIQIIAFIVLIALIGFVIFGLLLQFHIRQFQDGGTKEHFDQLHEWIKDNPVSHRAWHRVMISIQNFN